MAQAQQPMSGAIHALALEYKSLQEEPIGFQIKLVDDDNFFEWEVAIFGPPDTVYQGGYFKARMKFPLDFPYSPPSFRFVTKVWHPNVYENGDLCISILQRPVDNPRSGELNRERWNPTQSVRTILLSVISLLNEPNPSSAANMEASVMYQRWRDSNGYDEEYEYIIKTQVSASRVEAETDGVVVPTTLEEYCIKTNEKPNDGSVDKDIADINDDYYLDDLDEEYDDDEEENEASGDDES